MRRLAATFASLAFLASAAAAEARTFYVIQSGQDAWTVMDPEGIERIGDGHIRKAWTVRVQRNILTGDPPTPGYVRTLNEFDCTTSRTRWREFSAFSRSGGLLVSKVNPNPEWGPAEEASDTLAAHRVVCEGVGGGAVVSAESVAKVVIGLMGSWDPPPAPAAPPLPAVRMQGAPKAPAGKAAPAPAGKAAPPTKTAPPPKR